MPLSWQLLAVYALGGFVDSSEQSQHCSPLLSALCAAGCLSAATHARQYEIWADTLGWIPLQRAILLPPGPALAAALPEADACILPLEP